MANDEFYDAKQDDKIEAWAAVIIIATIVAGVTFWLMSMPS